MAQIALTVSDVTSPAAVAGEDVTQFRIRGGFDATETQVKSILDKLRKLGLGEDLVQIVSADKVKPAGSANSDAAAVREWAQANGHEVSSKGRISDEIRAAYAARNETPAEDDDADREPTDAELDAIGAE